MAEKKTSLRKQARNLFFFRRRPKTHIAQDYEKPADSAAYELELEYQGYISRLHWKDDDITQNEKLNQDLNDLEQHLMPAFWEFNQKASHYQNRYYLYQWIFMLGAWLTTILGVFTTYIYSNDALANSLLPEVFGYTTALVSGITAYFNVMSNQGNPQAKWAKARRLAEELRVLYFKYLAHLSPFDGVERVQIMRRKVLEIRRKEFENG